MGPLAMLAGVVLRSGPDFFYTNQLAAYDDRLLIGYEAFVLGNILLWPGIVLLARRSGGWGAVGGTLVIFGLFGRAFHSGLDHMAFRLVDTVGVDEATRIVGDSYATYYAPSILNSAILVGWVVLAVGTLRERTLPRWGSVALALTSALMIGMLKGTGLSSWIAVGGLVVALVPFGVTVLRDGPRPSVLDLLKWTVIVLAGLAAMVFLGTAG